MKRSAVVLGLLGLALFCGLFIWRGIGEVSRLLAGAGLGLLWVSLWHAVPLLFDVIAWRSVLITGSDEKPPPGLWTIYWIRWVGESINALLPVVSIGGELVKMRLVMQRGVPGARVAASVVVDMTLALMSEIVFVLAGLALLFVGSESADLPSGLGLGLAIATVLFLMIYTLQRRGPFTTLGRLLTRVGLGIEWLTRFGGIQALDDAIADLHSRHLAILRCGISRLAGWVFGTFEIWLATRVLGAPLSITDAFIMESLCQAIRTAGFAIPGALGIQEGGYVLVGKLLGLDEDTSLALSVMRRVRDIALGIPGLIVWQLAEGRRFIAQRGD